MGEKYWTGVRPNHGRIMLIAVPLVVTMAVGLIVGIRIAGGGASTLRLTSRGSGAPTPAARRTGRPAVSSAGPATAPRAARPGDTAIPGSRPSPSAIPTPTPIPTPAASVIATAVP